MRKGPRRWAIISIGTNSTRLLLADMEPEHPHVEITQSTGTRIGEGMDSNGLLGDEPMRRTLNAVRSYVRIVRGHYVHIAAIATSAVRRAHNGAAFSERVREIVGVPLRILSGEEEAAASYRGAITALDPRPEERVGAIDVGGGSTEFAFGNATQPEGTISCEIGAVRLTERVGSLSGREGAVEDESIEAAREMARAALAPLADFPRVERVALVGGSATTTAAILRSTRSRIDTFDLTRQQLAQTLERLCTLDYCERRELPGMKAPRADILPAGIIVLDTALAMLGHDAATVTTADLLLGYLLQQRDAEEFPLSRRTLARMEDQSIHSHIEKLIAEEHSLLERDRKQFTAEDHARLGKIEVQLDQYWDLLRQRRARRNAGQDPSDTHMRDVKTVEGYVE